MDEITYYLLDNEHNVVPTINVHAWANFFRLPDRIVKQEYIEEVKISTVFLGIDHSCTGEGPPIVFETMIFGGEHDGYQDRCATWVEAEAMHAKAVALVNGGRNA